jgi:hypothetical protein
MSYPKNNLCYWDESLYEKGQRETIIDFTAELKKRADVEEIAAIIEKMQGKSSGMSPYIINEEIKQLATAISRHMLEGTEEGK